MQSTGTMEPLSFTCSCAMGPFFINLRFYILLSILFVLFICCHENSSRPRWFPCGLPSKVEDWQLNLHVLSVPLSLAKKLEYYRLFQIELNFWSGWNKKKPLFLYCSSSSMVWMFYWLVFIKTPPVLSNKWKLVGWWSALFSAEICQLNSKIYSVTKHLFQVSCGGLSLFCSVPSFVIQRGLLSSRPRGDLYWPKKNLDGQAFHAKLLLARSDRRFFPLFTRYVFTG